MDFSIIVSIAIGLLAGAVVALRYIAPKTKTSKDDAILARLEALEKLFVPKNPE
jgi:hypothetical protein